MFEDTHELAESKLALLYIFDKIGYPISNTSLTEIVLHNGLLNYFQLQQYLGELVSAGFIYTVKQDKKQLYYIDTKGKNALEYFENRISDAKKDIINSYFSKRTDLVKKDIQITSEYKPENEASHTVLLRIIENNTLKIELKLDAGTKDNANKMCSKWNSDASLIYSRILDTFNK